MRITTTFPATDNPGKPIQPGAASVAVALPKTTVAELVKLHAASVAGTAQLSIGVSQNSATQGITWSGVTSGPTPIPAAGGMQVSATGAMPTVKVAAPGDVTFTAGDLIVNLFLRKADGTAPNPASISLACTPASGYNIQLATVHVSGAPAQQSAPAKASAPAKPSAPAKTVPAARNWPKGCGNIKNINPGNQSRGCSYIAGFSDVNKLNGAAFLQSYPGFLNIALGQFTISGQAAVAHGIARLDYNGLPELPPAKATLLSFGFMPTTATMHLTQVGGFAHITIRALIVPPSTYTIIVRQDLSLRISDVLVNGTPLNVGPNCHTVTPIHLMLKGGSPQFTNIFFGGPLSGTTKIPQFTGCGVGENLDPIFNSAISGPGNFAKITQGNLCEPPSNGFPAQFCPPLRPKPIR